MSMNVYPKSMAGFSKPPLGSLRFRTDLDRPPFQRDSRFRGNLVENTGVEPVTSCVQGRRSSQLS